MKIEKSTKGILLFAENEEEIKFLKGALFSVDCHPFANNQIKGTAKDWLEKIEEALKND